MNEYRMVRVVTPEPNENGITKTQGTKVFAGDTEIHGVMRIELTCEVNDLWRARIDVNIQPPADLSAWAITTYPTRWQRFLHWIKFGWA